MFGLIDCNNFFVSCERVFNPALVGKPVVVLSNNDGCAVAMSDEAKVLGISRGVPVYQVREIMRRNGVISISGKHRLYGDISSRVMATVESVVDDVEVYSIDEAFFRFPEGCAIENEKIAREIVRRVRRWTGIPTSVGIAPTRTLAKVAARFAKKYPAYQAVCAVDSEEKRRKALSLIGIGEVWGIGRKLEKRLLQYGVETALDFADMPLDRVRRIVNVSGERTWHELNGEPCIEAEPENVRHKQICSTRSFSPSLSDLSDLKAAVAAFMTIASRKLRRQKSYASGISVFIHTNRFRTDLPQYRNSAYRSLEEPANDLLTLVREAEIALESIYRPGLLYRRAGVCITDIVDGEAVQFGLFTPPEERDKRRRLMELVDTLNSSQATYDKVRVAIARPVGKTSGRSSHGNVAQDAAIQIIAASALFPSGTPADGNSATSVMHADDVYNVMQALKHGGK